METPYSGGRPRRQRAARHCASRAPTSVVSGHVPARSRRRVAAAASPPLAPHVQLTAAPPVQALFAPGTAHTQDDPAAEAQRVLGLAAAARRQDRQQRLHTI